MLQLFDENGGLIYTMTDRQTISLGRLPGNTIQLNDDCVSKFHARINFESGAYYLIDVGSTNGTFCFGKRVNKEMLRDGAIIQIGEFRLRVHLSGMQSAPPAREVGDAHQPAQSSPRYPAQPSAPRPANHPVPPPGQYSNQAPNRKSTYNQPMNQNHQGWQAPYPPQAQPPYQQQVYVNVKQPESSTFAVVTLLFYLFGVSYPIALIMNIVGAIGGPKKGCFVQMLMVFVVLPLVIIIILALFAYPVLESLYESTLGLIL